MEGGKREDGDKPSYIHLQGGASHRGEGIQIWMQVLIQMKIQIGIKFKYKFEYKFEFKYKYIFTFEGAGAVSSKQLILEHEHKILVTG